MGAAFLHPSCFLSALPWHKSGGGSGRELACRLGQPPPGSAGDLAPSWLPHSSRAICSPESGAPGETPLDQATKHGLGMLDLC